MELRDRFQRLSLGRRLLIACFMATSVACQSLSLTAQDEPANPKTSDGKTLSGVVKQQTSPSGKKGSDKKLPLNDNSSSGAAASFEGLVPQVLLGLLHAPEVQKEIGLEGSKAGELEKLFAETDGIWWRSRILPLAEQREAVTQLETKIREWLKENVSPAKIERLSELERRAQATRTLLRADNAEKLKLSVTQLSQIADAVREVDALGAKIQEISKSGKKDAALETKLTTARRREFEVLTDVLSDEQQRGLVTLLGPEFDTAKLQRVYPIAPELEASDEWINSGPLKLSDLRGKVVIVHFYAFECVNCKRNLPIYAQWADKYKERDVAIIGIQTPETAAEADPKAVRSAATADRIQYPVLIDLERKNWKAWANTMWPTVYVIDRQGYIRFWWQGELRWQGASGDKTVQETIEALLKEGK